MMMTATTRYGHRTCEVAHATRYVIPPLATVDWGRYVRVAGGLARYWCDEHARGLKGWRDSHRMIGAPEPDEGGTNG